MKKHSIDPNINSARYSEPEELKEDYSHVSYETTETFHPNSAAGLNMEVDCNQDGEVTGALVDGSDTSTIVVSSPGAGKTRRVIAPYILSVTYALQSFIVHDPKGEIYLFFKSLLERLRYRIRILNLRDPRTGDRLNPLQEAAMLWRKGEKGRAMEIVYGRAVTLYAPLEDANDKFWSISAINLFKCYFAIAATIYEPEHVTFATIYRLHIEGLRKVGSTTAMNIYLEAHKKERFYEWGIPAVGAPNDTRNSIYSIFTNGLVPVMMNEDVADMTTSSTFDVDELVDSDVPTALFIITRDESPATYSTIVSSFVDMIYTKLIDLAQTKYSNVLPQTVHFVLEEFGNIAKLENINDMMSAARSRNIRMLICVQSLCQLYMTYTKELAHVLIGNSQNLVFMASTDMELVKMISERCGTYIDPYTNKESPLVSQDRLTHLKKKKGEALMLLDRHYPYITSLPDLSMYKMICPMEKVRFPERKRVEVKEGVFTKIVADELAKKALDANKEAERSKAQYKQDAPKTITKDEMLSMPSELKDTLDDIISGKE